MIMFTLPTMNLLKAKSKKIKFIPNQILIKLLKLRNEKLRELGLC